MNATWNSRRSVFTLFQNPRSNGTGLRSGFVVILLVCLSLGAVAQQATIVGTVADRSGAALPAVTITMTSLDSHAVKKIQTNAPTTAPSTSFTTSRF